MNPREKQMLQISTKRIIRYFFLLGLKSKRVDVMLSTFGVCEPNPSKTSMKKKTAANNCPAGNVVTASGYMMKASPGPPVATCEMSTFRSCATEPMYEKRTKPAKMLVILLPKEIITASLIRWFSKSL